MRIERNGGSDLPAERAAAVRRVVLADREELTRSAAAAILAEDGFEVIGEASDPGQAVALTRALRPDVVVLGFDADGAAGLRALAEITGERIAPVVVLAADVAPAQVVGARDAGALAYLTKPPTRAALVPAVEVAIARFADASRLIADVAAAGHRLETRKLIDRAKGLLMTHRRMTEPEAFRWIQRTAMDRRKTSAAVAAQVVAELGEAPIRAAS